VDDRAAMMLSSRTASSLLREVGVRVDVVVVGDRHDAVAAFAARSAS
jgi:hypothetical protein